MDFVITDFMCLIIILILSLERAFGLFTIRKPRNYVGGQAKIKAYTSCVIASFSDTIGLIFGLNKIVLLSFGAKLHSFYS